MKHLAFYLDHLLNITPRSRILFGDDVVTKTFLPHPQDVVHVLANKTGGPRKQRFRNELVNGMHCLTYAIPYPRIISYDPSTYTIVFQRLQGQNLQQVAAATPHDPIIEKESFKLLGKMHSKGIYSGDPQLRNFFDTKEALYASDFEYQWIHRAAALLDLMVLSADIFVNNGADISKGGDISFLTGTEAAYGRPIPREELSPKMQRYFTRGYSVPKEFMEFFTAKRKLF